MAVVRRPRCPFLPQKTQNPTRREVSGHSHRHSARREGYPKVHTPPQTVTSMDNLRRSRSDTKGDAAAQVQNCRCATIRILLTSGRSLELGRVAVGDPQAEAGPPALATMVGRRAGGRAGPQERLARGVGRSTTKGLLQGCGRSQQDEAVDKAPGRHSVGVLVAGRGHWEARFRARQRLASRRWPPCDFQQ